MVYPPKIIYPCQKNSPWNVPVFCKGRIEKSIVCFNCFWLGVWTRFWLRRSNDRLSEKRGQLDAVSDLLGPHQPENIGVVSSTLPVLWCYGNKAPIFTCKNGFGNRTRIYFNDHPQVEATLFVHTAVKIGIIQYTHKNLFRQQYIHIIKYILTYIYIYNYLHIMLFRHKSIVPPVLDVSFVLTPSPMSRLEENLEVEIDKHTTLVFII